MARLLYSSNKTMNFIINIKFSHFFFIIFLILPFIALAKDFKKHQMSLTKDYYNKTCPRFEDIMRQIVTSKQAETPTTAAAVVRVFFHDCMVDGCDGSTLVASNHFHGIAERDADINLSLPGDAFDLVTRVKTALELECPGVVSCSDILATAARNLIKMTGGPKIDVLFGRKDGLVSQV